MVSILTPPTIQAQVLDENGKFTVFWFNFFSQLEGLVDPVSGQVAAINTKLATTIDVGLNVTITTAKLTLGGANGSMTFTKGVLTAHTAAT